MNPLRRLALVVTVTVTAAVALGALGLGGVVACDRPSESGRSDKGVAVDLPLMAFLSQARALHHEANVREAENDIPGAIRALERLTNAARPDGQRPEVAEVLADTYARLAELRAKSGDIAAATRDVESGLALARDRTYFRGHLLEVAGVVEETRATSLTDAGKAEEAAQARSKAVELLRQAVAIQEEVIRTTLGDASAPNEKRP
jgi:tetratricopeptide (TPR) repeat protein